MPNVTIIAYFEEKYNNPAYCYFLVTFHCNFMMKYLFILSEYVLISKLLGVCLNPDIYFKYSAE